MKTLEFKKSKTKGCSQGSVSTTSNASFEWLETEEERKDILSYKANISTNPILENSSAISEKEDSGEEGNEEEGEAGVEERFIPWKSDLDSSTSSKIGKETSKVEGEELEEEAGVEEHFSISSNYGDASKLSLPTQEPDFEPTFFSCSDEETSGCQQNNNKASEVMRNTRYCELCIHPKVMANEWCRECNLFLCSFHVEAHQGTLWTYGHDILKVDSAFIVDGELYRRFSPRTLGICPQHPHYICEVFCSFCSQCICRLCISLHSSHQSSWNLLETSYDIYSKEAEDYVLKLEKVQKEVKNRKEVVGIALNTLEVYLQYDLEQVQNGMTQLRKLLDKVEEKLTSNAQLQSMNLRKILQQKMQGLVLELEKWRQLEMKLATREQRPSEFLSEWKWMKERMEKLLSYYEGERQMENENSKTSECPSDIQPIKQGVFSMPKCYGRVQVKEFKEDEIIRMFEDLFTVKEEFVVIEKVVFSSTQKELECSCVVRQPFLLGDFNTYCISMKIKGVWYTSPILRWYPVTLVKVGEEGEAEYRFVMICGILLKPKESGICLGDMRVRECFSIGERRDSSKFKEIPIRFINKSKGIVFKGVIKRTRLELETASNIFQRLIQ